jgi:hypothetical protein
VTSALPAPDTVGAGSLHRVELSLAADAQMLFLARMTAAAVAARADFDYERVEDLRLAIDELCVGLMGAATGTGRLTLRFEWDDEGTLEVDVTLVPEEGVSANGHHPIPAVSGPSYELSERILDALVDDHGGESIGEMHRAWLRMRVRNPSGNVD